MVTRFYRFPALPLKRKYGFRVLANVNSPVHYVTVATTLQDCNIATPATRNYLVDTQSLFRPYQPLPVPQPRIGNAGDILHVDSRYVGLAIPSEIHVHHIPPSWYVRVDGLVGFLPIPYDIPDAMKPLSELPYLTDWLEEMRDADTDRERIEDATACVDLLREHLA